MSLVIKPIASGFAAVRTTVRHVKRHPATPIQRLRQLISAFAFQFTGRVFNHRKLVPIGSRMVMWADVHYGASFKVYCANPPDWYEMHVWKQRLGRGDLFIDVGANVGSYTLWAADLGARVIALEPDSDSRSRLVENLALNDVAVEVLPVALGPQRGTMPLTSGLGANHLLLGDRPDGAFQEVEVSTLDDILGDTTAAGVKIDVEGAELLVLQGADRALSEKRILCIQLEWNDLSSSLLGEGRSPLEGLLQRYGYRLYRPDERGNLHKLEVVAGTADVFALPQ